MVLPWGWQAFVWQGMDGIAVLGYPIEYFSFVL